MKIILLLLAFTLTALLACKAESAKPSAVVTTNQTYAVSGVVKSVAPDRRMATIHHQAIPHYMMEMTMDLPVRNTNELAGVSPGDKITFTLVVGENDDWIQNIRRVGHDAGAVAVKKPKLPPAIPELKPGDRLPDCELTTETGKPIHFADFRGRAVAFTFFFTRCPLPDYCPRMNKNFSETRQLLLAASGSPTNWQLFSISFDPDFDRPEMLLNYAGIYRGHSADRWLFAAMNTNALAELAPRLDLMLMREGASISHNLRTVVLDPNGVICQQFDGNEWTPQQLADAVLQAARVPAKP